MLFPRARARGLIEACVGGSDCTIAAAFPRARARGLIEATALDRLSATSTHFREHVLAASLKPDVAADAATHVADISASTCSRPH